MAGSCAVTVRSRLLLASGLMLFLELALIRWLGANVVHLAYFSNFVLMGSFLGIGLGFLRAAAPGRADRPMPLYSLVVLLGLVGFVSAYPVSVNRDSSQLIFFTTGTTSGPPIWGAERCKAGGCQGLVGVIVDVIWSLSGAAALQRGDSPVSARNSM